MLAGGLDRVVDIPTYCHAWLPVGMTFDDVQFETGWQTEADATVVQRRPGRAPGDPARGCRCALLARPARRAHRGPRPAGDDRGERRRARVDATASGALPPPRLRPISVSGLEEGQSRTVDVAGYLDSPLAAPACSITAASVEQGSGLTVTRSGCRLTLAVGTRPSPTASVALEVSDGPGRSARAAGWR